MGAGFALLLLVVANPEAEPPPAPERDDGFDFGELEAPAAPDPAELGEPGDDGFDFGELEGKRRTESGPSPWSLGGFARSEAGLWIERFESNPLAKLRQSLDLSAGYKRGVLQLAASVHGELDFAYLVERDSYDGPTLETYEWLVDLRKTHIGLSLDAIDLTIGWQILNWGEGDALSVTDLVNPRDLREPGLADLDDLRLPILMTRLGWFSGSHRLELVIAHERSPGYRTPPFGPFSPLPAIIAGDTGLDLEALLAGRDVAYASTGSRFSLENQGFFLRWSHRGQGLDFAVFFASAPDWMGTVRLPSPEAFAGDRIELPLEHRRYHAFGLSGARPVEDWLLRWELALTLDKHTSVLSAEGPLPDLSTVPLSSLSGLLAIQYAGIKKTTIALEMAQTFPFEDRRDTFFPLDTPQIALRVSHLALRDDLRVDLALSLFGWRTELGWVGRAEASYVLSDGLRLGLGFVTYQPSSSPGPMAGLDRHDRAFLKLRWDFSIL